MRLAGHGQCIFSRPGIQMIGARKKSDTISGILSGIISDMILAEFLADNRAFLSPPQTERDNVG